LDSLGVWTYSQIGSGNRPTFQIIQSSRQIGTATFICNSCEPACVAVNANNRINPFAEGLINKWKGNRTWSYNTTRTIQQDIRSDLSGTYSFMSSQMPFKLGQTSLTTFVWTPDLMLNTKWVRNSKTTAISKYGHVLQAENALDIPSSALYGYSRERIVASAKNSRYPELYFTGYEDLTYRSTNQDLYCHSDRWDLEHYTDPTTNAVDFLSDSIAHTGLHSLRIPANTPVRYVATRKAENNYDCAYKFEDGDYYLEAYGFLPTINPEPGKKYQVKVWIYMPGNCEQEAYDISSSSMIQTLDQNEVVTSITHLEPTSTIIDHWQQFTGLVEIPMNFDELVITFRNPNSLMYIDDLRFSPLKSEVKSFVYDPIKLRLMAILDPNHFSSFYEYDDEGNLIRTKKETERGIMTLQEVRKNITQ
jgi:hypothetical protein